MKKFLCFSIISLILEISTYAQQDYKYEYKFRLKKQPSVYAFEHLSDTIFEVAFIVTDLKGRAMPFAIIKIKSTYIDTVLQTDLNGASSFSKITGQVQIKISSVGFSTFTIVTTKMDSGAMILKCRLGENHSSAIGHLHSKRKLSRTEISRIVKDLTEEEQDNEFFKNKTCYIDWEI
ncbi:MAG: hypothetical protein ABI723_06800 [Bacteroidia bacterium]